jgi:hypothetical protein
MPLRKILTCKDSPSLQKRATTTKLKTANTMQHAAPTFLILIEDFLLFAIDIQIICKIRMSKLKLFYVC